MLIEAHVEVSVSTTTPITTNEEIMMTLTWNGIETQNENMINSRTAEKIMKNA